MHEPAPPLAWWTDRTDHRVKAALTKPCPVCAAPVGEDCGLRMADGSRGGPLLSGLIHQYRVPEKTLFEEVVA